MVFLPTRIKKKHLCKRLKKLQFAYEENISGFF